LVAGQARVVLLRIRAPTRRHAGRPLGGQVGLYGQLATAYLAARDQATVEVRVGGAHRDVEIRDADDLVAGSRRPVAVREGESRDLHLEVALVVALHLRLADAVDEGDADGPRDGRHGRAREGPGIRHSGLCGVSDDYPACSEYHPDEARYGQNVMAHHSPSP